MAYINACISFPDKRDLDRIKKAAKLLEALRLRLHAEGRGRARRPHPCRSAR